VAGAHCTLEDQLTGNLQSYRKKRHFDVTTEPKPVKRHSKTGQLFVVHKHQARNLHYDFRLEADGVLKSWAVPKGPSLDPSIRRLAMAVEDHPLDYAQFEGTIPAGEYGGGTVMVWDYGNYVPETEFDIASALRHGQLKFILRGKKLKGSWVLVHMRERQWLLIKHRDRYASNISITDSAPKSALTHRTLREIAAYEGNKMATTRRLVDQSGKLRPRARGRRKRLTSR
jgi:bifunctional non-homologous end joining protein LigD